MNEEQLRKIQELLEKIKLQSDELGREFPFANDPRFQSEQSIQGIQDYGKAFEDLTNQAESFSTLLDGINNDLGGIAASITATIQELGASSEGYNNIKSSLRGIGRIARDLKLDQEDIVKLNAKQLESLDRRLQQNIALYEINQAAIQQRKEDLQDEIAVIEEEKRRGAILTKRELNTLDKKKKELADIIIAENLINDEIEARNPLLDGNIDREKTLSQILEARIQQRKREEEEIKDSTKQAKSLSDFLAKIPLIGPAAKEAFQDLEAEIRKVREETGKIPEDFNGLATYIGLLSKKVAGLIPILLVNQLIKSLKEVDATAGNIAKEFNFTYNEALAIRNEMVRVADASFETFVNSKALLETLSTINRSLGTSQFVGLSDGLQESVVFLTKLREQAGFTNDEIAGISQLVLSTGKGAEEITGEFLAQAQISSARQGVLINEKEVFREIKNISAATLLSLQRSPAAIADAAATAKSLGLELSKVEQIANGLLQFESSITAELEAELLLGRNLNLERARFAALNNDIATVAKEIAKQAGSAAEFSKLNRLQQQSLADAVMMSREELGSTLLIQEQLGNLTGKEAERRRAVIDNLIAERGLQGAINVLGQESIENLEHQASVAEEFNAIINRLKERFVQLATALAPIGRIFSFILTIVEKIVTGVEFLMGSLGGIMSKVAGESEEEQKQLTNVMGSAGSGALIGAGIGSFFGGVGAIPGAMIGAALGGLGTAYTEGVFNMADDLYLPNKSKYGETTIKAPEGTFKLNNDDKAIIAGTDSSLRSIDSQNNRLIQNGVTEKIINSRDLREISEIIKEGANMETSMVSNQQQILPVSNINNTSNSTISNNQSSIRDTAGLGDLKELIALTKKNIEATENQTRVLAAESERTRRSKQKLEVGVQDFGTDINMYSSRLSYG